MSKGVDLAYLTTQTPGIKYGPPLLHKDSDSVSDKFVGHLSIARENLARSFRQISAGPADAVVPCKVDLGIANGANEILDICLEFRCFDRDRLYEYLKGLRVVTDKRDVCEELFAKLWHAIQERLDNMADWLLYWKSNRAMTWCIGSESCIAEKDEDANAHMRFGEVLRLLIVHCDSPASKRRKIRRAVAEKLIALWRRQKRISQHEELMALFRFVLVRHGFGFKIVNSKTERVELFKLIEKGVEVESCRITAPPKDASPTTSRPDTPNYAQTLPGLRNIFAPNARKKTSAGTQSADKNSATEPTAGTSRATMDHPASDVNSMTEEQLRDAIVDERQKHELAIASLKQKTEQASKKGLEEGQQDINCEIKRLKKQLNKRKSVLGKSNAKHEVSDELEKMQAELSKREAELAESRLDASNLRTAIAETERSRCALAKMTQRAVDAELSYLETALDRVTAHLKARLEDTIGSAKQAKTIFTRLVEERGKEDALCRSWGAYLRSWVDIADAIQTALVDARHRVDERAAGIRARDQRLAAMTPEQLLVMAAIPAEPPAPPSPSPHPLLQFDSSLPSQVPSADPTAALDHPQLPSRGAAFTEQSGVDSAGVQQHQINSRVVAAVPAAANQIPCRLTAGADSATLPDRVGCLSADPPQSSVGGVSCLLERDDECAICLVRLDLDGALRESCPACGQVYHAKCLTEWASINPACPNCRSQLR